MLKEFFSVAFNPGALVCIGKDIYDRQMVSVDDKAIDWTSFQYLSHNEFSPGSWERRDKEVKVFRTLFIEIDKYADGTVVPLDVQQDLVENVLKMPYSVKTFSGGKSYHYLICLEDPVNTLEEFKYMSTFLLNDVHPLFDKSNTNPSKFCRTPTAIRPDTGAKQELLEIKGRIPNRMLLDFLAPYSYKLAIRKRMEAKGKLQSKLRAEEFEAGENQDRMLLLNDRTRHFLETREYHGERHRELMLAAADLARAGFVTDEQRLILESIALEILPERNDLNGILNWVSKNIDPEY